MLPRIPPLRNTPRCREFDVLKSKKATLEIMTLVVFHYDYSVIHRLHCPCPCPCNHGCTHWKGTGFLSACPFFDMFVRFVSSMKSVDSDRRDFCGRIEAVCRSNTDAIERDIRNLVRYARFVGSVALEGTPFARNPPLSEICNISDSSYSSATPQASVSTAVATVNDAVSTAASTAISLVSTGPAPSARNSNVLSSSSKRPRCGLASSNSQFGAIPTAATDATEDLLPICEEHELGSGLSISASSTDHHRTTLPVTTLPAHDETDSEFNRNRFISQCKWHREEIELGMFIKRIYRKQRGGPLHVTCYLWDTKKSKECKLLSVLPRKHLLDVIPLLRLAKIGYDDAVAENGQSYLIAKSDDSDSSTDYTFTRKPMRSMSHLYLEAIDIIHDVVRKTVQERHRADRRKWDRPERKECEPQDSGLPPYDSDDSATLQDVRRLPVGAVYEGEDFKLDSQHETTSDDSGKPSTSMDSEHH